MKNEGAGAPENVENNYFPEKDIVEKKIHLLPIMKMIKSMSNCNTYKIEL